MSKSTVCGALGLALVLAGAAGCSSKKAAVYEHENFDDSGTFSRSFPVSETGSCEAARRALLSQGYIITSADKGQVIGNKSFQQTGETHLQISFNVVCAADMGGGKRSTMFANALQDRYALKKSNTSASLGVGVLGSVSMPIGSSDDSMVKVASETVTSTQFYERYFALVESFLPKETKKKAAVSEEPAKPQAELGVPEPVAAPAPAALVAPVTEAPVVAVEPAPAPAAPVAPVVETPAAPVVDDSKGSQPIAPPAEAAPISGESTTPVVTEPSEPAVVPAAPETQPTPTSGETPAAL